MSYLILLANTGEAKIFEQEVLVLIILMNVGTAMLDSDGSSE
jgi:hypothetical protein